MQPIQRVTQEQLEEMYAAKEVTDEAFAAAIAGAIQELGAGAMAQALRVSRPSVERWARGKNLPHEALRPAVMKWLASRPR